MRKRVPILIGWATLLAMPAAAAGEWPMMTPKPAPVPQINGPSMYGARPGHPFLYRIPCTGDRPIQFTAKGLPPGLTLDEGAGIIRGTTPAKPGDYRVTIGARNRRGRASRDLRIVVGKTLSLTPQMGWNSWYTHYAKVTDKVMREAADVMIASGMADFGYQYVSIDDCWARKADATNPRQRGEARDPAGNILPNDDFPDMKALTDYIHAKGLKAGTYSSPGPLTCGGYTASWHYEEQDARTIASWGFDLLKYDFCSYSRTPGAPTLEEKRLPYQKMGTILESMPRDIVLNISSGRAQGWNWGGEAGAQSWRTTGDLGMEKDTSLPGFYSIGFQNAGHWKIAGPGQWNDPDYILIGYVADAHTWKEGKPAERVRLTADEQYSYMSMWALMAAPLFFGGDMARLDEFTLNILCNAEVIAIDQDPLGKQGRIVRKTADEFILAKPLEDGSVAVGFFNLTIAPKTIEATWSDLEIKGKRRVRDPWRQKTIGPADGKYAATVAPHGVALVRLLTESRQ